MAKKKINVEGLDIALYKRGDSSYVSLTDMVRNKSGETADYIKNWIRNNTTVLFLGTWEIVHNENFKLVQYNQIKNDYLRNDYLMSPKKWTELTGAIGIESKAGRYGGTFAHTDIAIHFANWLSPECYVYLVKEFQQLKQLEVGQAKWDIQRYLSRINYHIHTNAIRENKVPGMLVGTKKEGFYFASEADLLNLIVFGITAKEWKAKNPQKGNLRETATQTELHVLSNMEAINAALIDLNFAIDERAEILSNLAEKHFSIINQRKKLK